MKHSTPPPLIVNFTPTGMVSTKVQTPHVPVVMRLREFGLLRREVSWERGSAWLWASPPRPAPRGTEGDDAAPARAVALPMTSAVTAGRRG